MSVKKKLLVIGESQLTSNLFDKIENENNIHSLFKVKRLNEYGKNILSKEVANNIRNGLYDVIIIGPTPHKITSIESGVSLSNWLRSLNVRLLIIEAKTASNNLKFTKESYGIALKKAREHFSVASA